MKKTLLFSSILNTEYLTVENKLKNMIDENTEIMSDRDNCRVDHQKDITNCRSDNDDLNADINLLKGFFKTNLCYFVISINIHVR